jgi:hypothetical protein
MLFRSVPPIPTRAAGAISLRAGGRARRPAATRQGRRRPVQRDLEYYNLDRSHQAYRLRGHTPAQALREALGVDELPPLVGSGDHEEDAEGLEPVAA